MKIISNKEDFIIFLVKTNLDNIDLKEYVKKLIIKLKNKLKRYISGYYKVNVYINNYYGMIIELLKEEEYDFFKDFVELDINIIENSKMYFEFTDYFTIINKTNIYYYNNNYYVNIDKLNKKEILKLSEYGKIIYGNELKNIETKLKKVECAL